MNRGEFWAVIVICLAIIVISTYKFFAIKSSNLEGGSLDNLIVLDEPKPNSVIFSPLKIRGKARGNWFFEASFPIVLTDWDGKIIAEYYATAKDDWMTTEFVPFEADLKFEKPSYGKNGFLILKKDNPSGLPENDNALEIPVFFE